MEQRDQHEIFASEYEDKGKLLEREYDLSLFWNDK